MKEIEGNCRKCLGCNRLEDEKFEGDGNCPYWREIEREERRREGWRIVKM